MSKRHMARHIFCSMNTNINNTFLTNAKAAPKPQSVCTDRYRALVLKIIKIGIPFEEISIH